MPPGTGSFCLQKALCLPLLKTLFHGVRKQRLPHPRTISHSPLAHCQATLSLHLEAPPNSTSFLVPWRSISITPGGSSHPPTPLCPPSSHTPPSQSIPLLSPSWDELDHTTGTKHKSSITTHARCLLRAGPRCCCQCLSQPSSSPSQNSTC